MAPGTQADCLRDCQTLPFEPCDTDATTRSSSTRTGSPMPTHQADVNTEIGSDIKVHNDSPKFSSKAAQFRNSQNHSLHRQNSTNAILKTQTSIPRVSRSASCGYVHVLQCLLKESLGDKGSELADAFANVADSPPITAESLDELNVENFKGNIRLRHDINFDHELHFRPNMDCSTGREKIGLAKQYWKALIAELELCLLLANESSLSFAETSFDLSRAIQESQRRVPLMFKTLKDILRSILPEVDHAQIDDVLDVPIIMQQTQRGNFDLACLSRWLSKLLKTHCAPMRDKWVDKMVMLMGDGAETACAQSIVDGFRELLGILEAMKLDVANHQVRHLRTIFVEDTIRFEQRYHQGQFFDVKDAQQWLARNILQQKALPSLREVRLPEKLTALVYAILQTLLSSAASRVYFPHIFSLDLDRLASLRAGLLDQVHLNICLFIYKDLLKLSRAFPSSSSLTSESALQQALLIIIGPTKATHENPSRRWLAHIPNLAVHLVRAAFPFLSSSCAPTLLETTEYNLAASLQPSSPIFQRAATALFHALLPPLLADVAAHVDSSPLVLSNTFVPTLPPSTLAPTPSSISAGLEGRGMATGGQWRLDEGDKRLQVLRWRLAHVAVLHWQVWAPLVYLVDGDAVNGEVEKGGARNGAEN